MNTIKVSDCGVIEYGKAWDLQKELFGRQQEGGTEEAGTLLYCEHPHVYTLGKSGHMENLLVSGDFLRRVNATFFRTDRGGDITYHGYGQLVGYPILDLNRFGMGLKEYIDRLEQCVIDTIARFGIEGRRVKGATGVWVGEEGRERKICAIGVKASRYITMHGFALNVTTDLAYFNYINPCGFTTKGVCSIAQLCEGKREAGEVSMERVKQFFTEEFASLFDCEIRK